MFIPLLSIIFFLWCILGVILGVAKYNKLRILI
jgi:hypothetical protein